MNPSQQYRRQLCAEISEQLTEDHKYFRSRHELRFPSARGHNSVIVGGVNYSPNIDIVLYFGCFYNSVEKSYKNISDNKRYYHIFQNTYNVQFMNGLDYSGPAKWGVNINYPKRGLADEIVAAIRGIAFPFFARYPTEQTARDALVGGDPWCLDFWFQVLPFDAALGELDRFEAWASEMQSIRKLIGRIFRN